MFGNVTTLHGLHVNLLQQVEEAMAAEPTNPNLAKPLVGKAKMLIMYLPYAVGYELAQKTRLKLVTIPTFAEALETIEWKRQKGHNALKQILITPIQRNPRYRMYIEQLLKATPRDDPQHQDLCTALEEVTTVLFKIEEAKRENLSREAIVALRDTLTGSFAPLHEPDIFVLRPTGKRHAFRKHEPSPPPAPGAPAETDDLTCCHYCRLSLKDCVFYLCSDCKWRVHDRCYSLVPPNCAGKQQNLVSIVKASRRLIERFDSTQVVWAPWNSGSADGAAALTEDFQPANLYLFNDGLLLCSGVVNTNSAQPPTHSVSGHSMDLHSTWRRGTMSSAQLSSHLVEKSAGPAAGATTNKMDTVRGGAGSAAAGKTQPAAEAAVAQPPVTLIDFCHFYSAFRDDFATCVDVHPYGPLLLVKNPHTDSTFVLMFCDAASKFHFLTLWSDWCTRWCHSNSTLVAVARENTSSNYSLEVLVEKESSSFMQKEYTVHISVPMKGNATHHIVKKHKDLAAFHASLSRVFDQSALPPLPDVKQISKQKDEGKIYGGDVKAFLTAILLLPGVLDLEEVDLFFGKIMPEIRVYSKSLHSASKSSAETGQGEGVGESNNDEASRLQAKLDSPLFLIYFRKFLERQGKDGYLDFFLAVQDLRRLRGVDKIETRARRIWERFDSLLMGLDAGPALQTSFAPKAHVLSYASVFNGAYDTVRTTLSDLTSAFLMSPEFHEMTGDDAVAGDSDKILELDMSNVMTHTQLCTIVNHPQLLPQFSDFCKSRYVGELLLGWRKLWEFNLAVAHCRRSLLVTENKAKVLPMHAISMTELKANHDDLAAASTSSSSTQTGSAWGFSFGLPDGEVPTATSLEDLEEAFPPLPVLSQNPRQQVVALVRFARHFRDTFVSASAENALSFSPDSRRDMDVALDILAKAPSLASEESDFAFTAAQSDLELLLTSHLLAFVKHVEQERIAKMEAALKNNATPQKKAVDKRKASVASQGHQRVHSSTIGSGSAPEENAALGGAAGAQGLTSSGPIPRKPSGQDREIMSPKSPTMTTATLGRDSGSGGVFGGVFNSMRGRKGNK